MMAQKGQPRVALVIGSGGIKCAAAIGMWRVLQAENIHVDSVVGCSGGSMYGAFIAKGASKDGSLKFNERSGLVDDAVLNKNLTEAYGSLSFSDLHIPLKVVATDMFSGEKVILSDGGLFDAIRASLAIPIIFPPWDAGGRLLIDGAASDPLPIDVAIQDGADIIIAMGFTLGYRSRMRSMTAVQEQLNSIYMNHILNATFAFYNLAHHAEIFPILPEFDEPVSMFDIDKIPDMIECGEQATRAQMPHIKRLLAGS